MREEGDEDDRNETPRGNRDPERAGGRATRDGNPGSPADDGTAQHARPHGPGAGGATVIASDRCPKAANVVTRKFLYNPVRPEPGRSLR